MWLDYLPIGIAVVGIRYLILMHELRRQSSVCHDQSLSDHMLSSFHVFKVHACNPNPSKRGFGGKHVGIGADLG